MAYKWSKDWSEKMRNITEQKSPCITTYTRTNKKQSNYNRDDYTAALIIGGIGAFLGYGLWIASIILGVNPW